MQEAASLPVRIRKYLQLAFFGTLLFLLFVGTTYLIQHIWGDEACIRWGGLIGFTLVLFGLFVADSETVIRTRRFWVLFGFLAAGHLAAFAVVLTKVREWKLPWFMVMAFEYLLFLLFRRLFVSPEVKEAGLEERG
jgi:hypothetical protein